MRPLALTVRAFGPFAGEQRLDFGELGGRRLFLVTGPTGAGKTTLLDAICFALYGDTSGDEREGSAMRCDLSGPADLTEVILDFALGERRFRVRRVPEQERPKRRGEGTTLQKADATLWERTAGEEEGSVLASGWSRVTRAAEELLGFSSTQFRQVIMLPQGRFRELLTAGSAERERILQTLFQTTLYARIQEALKERKRGLQERHEKLSIRRRTLLEAVGAEDEEALAERIRASRERLEELERRLDPLREAETRAVAALHGGRALQERFDALAGAERRMEELEREAPAMDTLAARLEQAERAAALEDLHRQLDAARKRAADAAGRLDGAERAEAAAVESARAAERVLAAELKREPELLRLQGRLEELARHRDSVRDIADARSKLESTRHSLAGKEREREAAGRALEEALSALEENREAIAAAKEAAARLDGVAREAERAAGRVRERRALEEARAAAQRLAAGRQEAQQRLDAAEATLARARGERDRLQQALLEGQAALLARELAEGEPCPVCGSPRHPHPAEAAGEVPGREVVAAAARAAGEAEQARDQARSRLGGVEGEAGLAEQRAASLAEQLGGAARLPLGELEAAAVAAGERLRETREAAEALPALEARRDGLERTRQQREEALAALGDAVGELEQRRAAAEQVLAERERVVPEAWRDPDTLDRAAAETEAALQRGRESLRAAREMESRTTRERAAACAAREAAAKEAGENGKALDTAGRLWRERAGTAGFDSEETWQAARLEERERSSRKERLETHRREVDQARALLAAARQGVADAPPPDLAALERVSEEAGRARSEAEREQTALAGRLEALQKSAGEIAGTRRAMEGVEQEYRVVGHLSRTANGQNPDRLSFQRFVLAALLDDVLLAASQRLARMSRGRYRLQRVTDPADRRTLGGLDLEVEDAYTGTARPVATLSGGEGFLAALALALGLAEVVEAYAGGIRLDTIFIDEGFGSLDPEALDLAVNTLVDLQDQGRLVGVISHVPELKERIDVRLEVASNRGASSARFVLP